MVISADLPYGGPSFPERYKAWRNRQLEAGNKAIDDFGTWLMRELGLKATPSVEGSPVVDPRDDPRFGQRSSVPRGTGPSAIPQPTLPPALRELMPRLAGPPVPGEPELPPLSPELARIIDSITSKYRAPFSGQTYPGYNEDKYPPPMVGPVDPELVSPSDPDVPPIQGMWKSASRQGGYGPAWTPTEAPPFSYPGQFNPPFDPASPIPTPPVSVRATPPGGAQYPDIGALITALGLDRQGGQQAPLPPQGSNDAAATVAAMQQQQQPLPTVNVPQGGYGLNPQGSNAYGAGMSGNNVAEYFRLKAMGLVP